MDKVVLESYLYTSDYGEDAYLLNSSSSSDSEDEDYCTCIERVQPEKKIKREGFVEIEVPQLNEYDFRHNFRVSKSTFIKVVEMLQYTFRSERKGGRERVNPEKASYILLWYLGNQETFQQISDRFNKTTSCIHHVVKVGTNAVVSRMSDHILWPSKEEYPSIAQMFQDVTHLRRCLGVLGVSHIKIIKPKHDINYVCSKQFHSLAVQGAITINGKFMDLFISEGSNHPEIILEKSCLLTKSKDIFDDYYLVGFNDYINHSWLVQQFKNTPTLTEAQEFFNECHETAKSVFPEALGLLKGRFQRLQFFENRDVPFTIQCIQSACILHNLAIDFDEDTPDFSISDEGIFDEVSYSDLIVMDESDTRQRLVQELVESQQNKD